MLHGVPALVRRHGCRCDARRRIDAVAQVDGHRLRVEVVGQVAAHVRHFDVMDVVVAEHLLGHLGAREAAGELHLRIFAEYRLQACLHGVAGDTDDDDQDEHSHRRRRIVCRTGGRFGVVSCLEQGEKHVCHSHLVFSVCVICARLLRGHQYHFINGHMGR